MSEPLLSEADYDAVTDAAAHWCMRLHAEDCTDAERRIFAQWHAADPRHASEYQAMCEIWELSADVPAVNPAPTPLSLAVPAPAMRHRTRNWHPLAAAAAIVALALPVAGYIGWNQGLIPNAYETYDAQDAPRLVTMSDGSRVELNLGTRLTYLNFKDRRSVTLAKGEAFFEVSHDSAHPFIVAAGQGSVRVTGTRFNVWLYDEQVRVTLVDGSVQVRSDRTEPASDTRLAPGMQASYRPGDSQPRVNTTSVRDTSLAWRSGKLIFNDLPLSEALPLINRYLPEPILLGDKATGDLRLGGSYNTRDMSTLLATLPRVLPVRVTQNQQGNPVLTKRTGSNPRG
ncbi:FecR family protein [Pseudomonas sp. v388]|uniref:FecR family protein n=1 Tax=Pseudomonas sp. v388 TaxID=2479849 RepID=UPI000F7AE493|nr:FecR family protein [Pseudomonas sp. v388]RRV05238.1 FecR family protein [Pseudomonas sp. v388]